MIVLIEDPMSKTGLKDWNDPTNNENEKKVKEKYYNKKPSDLQILICGPIKEGLMVHAENINLKK